MEEGVNILDEKGDDSPFDELKKRKLVRKTQKIKDETESLNKKFVTALDYLSEYFNVTTTLNDSVRNAISSANIVVNRKSAGFKIVKTNTTITSIGLRWTQSKSNNALYQLEMKAGVNGKPTFPYYGKNTKWTAHKLTPNTTYSFRVRPKIDDFYGNWSDPIVVRTDSLKIPQRFECNATGPEEIKVTWNQAKYATSYKLEMKKRAEDAFKEVYKGNKPNFTRSDLSPNTEYSFRLRAVYEGSRHSDWSKIINVRTKDNKIIQKLPPKYGWKRCPQGVRERKKYLVDEKNPRIATNAYVNDWCTILGREPIRDGIIVEYGVKILKSEENDGHHIYIGVTHQGIDQGANENFKNYGWYFNCYDSTLWSGIHHEYRGKKYGPKKTNGDYIHNGDTVGVVMDTIKGELSFVLNGVNLGVAYEEIPSDKSFIPCVILENKDDSVELNLSGVKENVNNTNIAPSNITATNITWDMIRVSWNDVKGAPFYQVEVNSSTQQLISDNFFIVRNVDPDGEYKFRVRTVSGNSVSEWSDLIRAKGKHESFKLSKWEERLHYIYGENDCYVDDDDPMIIRKSKGNGYYTAIGSTAIPPNQVSTWSIKILRSGENDGEGIYIGIAQSDINQNGNNVNYTKCGWFFDCYDSTICSGPPHNYEGKEYGPRKWDGEYIYMGDSVGISMDTEKGELSFILSEVNYGVAYESIPLDKPLVPCVILKNKDDSVKLDLSEVKENKKSFIPCPSNIEAKSTTWDSITLTWNVVENASLYQIEVNGNKWWELSTTNSFTKKVFFQKANTVLECALLR